MLRLDSFPVKFHFQSVTVSAWHSANILPDIFQVMLQALDNKSCILSDPHCLTVCIKCPGIWKENTQVIGFLYKMENSPEVFDVGQLMEDKYQ